MAQLQVLELALELITELRPVVARIQAHDRDLACQLRRAASSVALNISEGAQRVGKDRNHGYRIAAGSAAESRTALRVAQGWGYVSGTDVERGSELLARILAMLWRLTH